MKTIPLFLSMLCVALSVAFGMDYFTNPMASATGWANASSSGTFNVSTYDGRSAMRVYVPAAGSGYYGGAFRPTWVSGRVLHVTAVINTTSGTKASGDYFQFQLQKNTGALTAQFASDGLYILNNAGTAINTGITVPTNNWTTWDIYSNQTANATALCTVYRNDVVVGSDIACAGGSAAYTTGQLYLTQYGNQTSGVSTDIDTVSVTGGGWEFKDTAANISAWTKTTSNATACTAVQETSSNGETYFNMTVQNVSSSSIHLTLDKYLPVNTPTTKGVLEFKAQFNSLGDFSMTDRQFMVFSSFRSTATGFSVSMAKNGFAFGASWTVAPGSSSLVDLGTPHVWRFEYDLSTLLVNVKKDGVLVLSNVSFVTTGSTGGRILLQQRGGNAYTNSYIYWVHAYSGDDLETEVVE